MKALIVMVWLPRQSRHARWHQSTVPDLEDQIRIAASAYCPGLRGEAGGSRAAAGACGVGMQPGQRDTGHNYGHRHHNPGGEHGHADAAAATAACAEGPMGV